MSERSIRRYLNELGWKKAYEYDYQQQQQTQKYPSKTNRNSN